MCLLLYDYDNPQKGSSSRDSVSRIVEHGEVGRNGWGTAAVESSKPRGITGKCSLLLFLVLRGKHRLQNRLQCRKRWFADGLYLVEKDGERGRNRTFNLLIKSQWVDANCNHTGYLLAEKVRWKSSLGVAEVGFSAVEIGSKYGDFRPEIATF